MWTFNNQAKQFFGANDTEYFVEEWNENYVDNSTDIFNEELNIAQIISTVLYIDQSTPDLTIGKLVAKILNQFYTEKETFWVNLEDRDVYCYDPCPDPSFYCCSTEEPIEIETPDTENKNTWVINSINKYSWMTWADVFYSNSPQQSNEFTLVQDYTKAQESLNCGALEITNNIQLDFYRENCKAKLRPLCMRDVDDYGPSVNFDLRKRKTQYKKNPIKKKKKSSRNKKKNSKKRNQSLGRQGKQLTDTGRPIEMCATVLPALIGNNTK